MIEKIMGNSIVNSKRASQLMTKYGSPLYLYDAKILKKKAEILTEAAKGFHISYAMKANSNSHIIKILQDSGVKNVDVVSPGQIYKALNCGYQPNQILYTQNFISEQELDYAISKGVIINIGALQTLKFYKEKLKGKKIFIRINPQLGAGQTYQVITGGPRSKFGIYFSDIQQAIKIAKQNQIHIIGLHQHIGSNLKQKDQKIFIDTVKYIFEMSLRFDEVQNINIGGGIGINYKKDEKVINIFDVYKQVRQIKEEHQKKYEKNIQIWIQPGRYLVADSGILLCKITAKKSTPQRVFYGTNTGFNHLIRPAFYGSHHQIYNLSNPQAQKQKVTVCGNICECSDNLGTQIDLGGQIGDILCIQNVGAYGFSMSMNYNQRLKPAEVMIQGQTQTLIRRRQTYEDLVQKM